MPGPGAGGHLGRGRHDQLVKAGGVYAELYNTQFAKALENEREMAENVWDGVVIDDSDY